MLLETVVSNTAVFEWIAQHLQIIGWPALCIFVYKLSGYVKGVTDQAAKTVNQIDKMATNCFPTMQSSLLKQDDLLHSMDASLKTMVENTNKPIRKKKS